MNDKNKKRISKFLSLILRHNPDKIGLELDENGWADINELITKANKRNVRFSKENLEDIVETNDKKRFAFNDDKTKIRANQGHSITTIDLKLDALEPPAYLYHGTVGKFINAIKTNGLQKMSRQHVHLTSELETAVKVGSRRGQAIILSIRAKDMHDKGYTFYQSENGVWLTDAVPAEFIAFKN
ncbi:RNA 2'-phosphotransferase [Pontimicrobium sp. MEBiC01747]